MNPQTAYQKQLDWLIKLASNPGWKEYSWARAQELDKDQSGLFKGIAEDLKNRMQRKQHETPNL